MTPYFIAAVLALLPSVAFADEGSGLTLDITHTDTQVVLGIGVAIGVLVVVLLSFRSQVKLLVRREMDVAAFAESRLLAVTTAISQELNLQPLLQRIMDTVTEILDADRSTLFLHDPKTGELWSNVAQGLETKEIRFPAHLGLAGGCFTSAEVINIPDAYADDRFNPSFDKKTGYRTRSILCFPVRTKQGDVIGVIQVLNKTGGPFTEVDETRLGAFTAQAAVAIENAQLFEEVITMKNYSEAILQSMTEGVLTLDNEQKITRANAAAYQIFGDEAPDVVNTGEHRGQDTLVNRTAKSLLGGANEWILESIARVRDTGELDESLDQELWIGGDQSIPDPSQRIGSATSADGKPLARSINVSVRPLLDAKRQRIGFLVVFEDISNEKRVRATMARYVPKEVTDRLMQDGGDALGGTLQTSTVLFSDIRSFTALSEKVGPQETVGMLNEYFTIMADIVMAERGILDKYIGDAIMAVFGAPLSTGRDADHAVRAAIDMLAALRAFNHRRGKLNKDAIDIGIGVNTDEVLSGNIGSAKRMDYTVIGDGVNLAARLESANKTYGTRLLLSELTVNELTDDFALRQVDRITVKGKSAPVGIFEPKAAWFTTEPVDVDTLFGVFGEGIALYRQREWAHATKRFEEALRIGPDKVSQLYVKRCAHFAANPPPTDWAGEWVMTTK